MSKNDITTDICIIGGGLVGLTAALKLAQSGANVTLCAPKEPLKDTRTTALLMQTVTFFQELELWAQLENKAFPLKTMRIVDGTQRLIRAPQTDFKASEIDLEAFGFNIKNSDILTALKTAIENHKNILRIEGAVKEILLEENKELLIVQTENEILRIKAGFVVGADGKNSIVRHSNGIKVRDWEYPQSAIVVDFEHTRSSEFTSTEFHTETGPFTIVPHSNHKAGLVWMEKPITVEGLLKLSKKDMEVTLENKMQSFLGKITLTSQPQSFPIKGLVANSFGEQNWAILGEAAHVFPPIGAQGFNLGIRDIEALSNILSRYTNQENRGLQYDRARKYDINARTYGVDLLNRSLLSDFLPIQMMRGFSLHILGSIKPLRKYVMKAGISPNL